MENSRVVTGIAGFDNLIQGGFPRRSINLVSGPAGSGKSLFAAQFAYSGCSRFGETSLVVILEENRSNIIRLIRSFGMDLEAYEKNKSLHIIDLGEIKVQGGKRGIVDFEDIQDLLDNCLKSTNAKRLVIDSVSAVGLAYKSAEDLREGMLNLVRFLREIDVTSLLVTESIEGRGLTRYGIEQFVADSFIVLALEEVMGELRRTITIRKMRFTKHDTGKHPFLITSKGIEVLAGEKVI